MQESIQPLSFLSGSVGGVLFAMIGKKPKLETQKHAQE
jgi:hypothetical protein